MFQKFGDYLASLGFTRESELWLWTQIITVATLIATNVLDVNYWTAYVGLHLSTNMVHGVWVLCVALLFLSGKLDKSPLPGAPK